jgi:hypothetical protein
MNIAVKARYVFEVSSDEIGVILKALEALGIKGEPLRQAILDKQRPQLEQLIAKFSTHLDVTVRDGDK